MIWMFIIPLLALSIIIWFIILDTKDKRNARKTVNALNANDFSKYYKFPLKMWEGTTGKVFTDDNNMAFDWLLPYGEKYNGIKQRLLDRINGYDYTSWSVKKTFYESGEGYIVCRIEEGENAGNEVRVLLVRGWGMLTGVGGYNLPSDKAAEIQDAFADYCVEMLNKK